MDAIARRRQIPILQAFADAWAALDDVRNSIGRSNRLQDVDIDEPVMAGDLRRCARLRGSSVRPSAATS